MMRKTAGKALTWIAVPVAVLVLVRGAEARGHVPQYSPDQGPSPTRPLSKPAGEEEVAEKIRRAFQEKLNREPGPAELQFFLALDPDTPWSPRHPDKQWFPASLKTFDRYQRQYGGLAYPVWKAWAEIPRWLPDANAMQEGVRLLQQLRVPEATLRSVVTERTVTFALDKAFEEEERLDPALRPFLVDHQGAPFKQAMADFRERKGGPGLNGLIAWVKQQKAWYLEHTGIEKHLVKEALVAAFAAETRHYPALREYLTRVYLTGGTRSPYKYTVAEVRAGRVPGGAAGVRNWLQRPEVRDHFVKYAGVGHYLGNLQRQAARDALLAVFAPEVRQFPALADYLADETQLPFKHALMDLQDGRNGGGPDGVRAWIQQNKSWYLGSTGIEEQRRKRVELVAQAYRRVFNRDPDAGELGAWLRLSLGDQRVASVEAAMLTLLPAYSGVVAVPFPPDRGARRGFNQWDWRPAARAADYYDRMFADGATPDMGGREAPSLNRCCRIVTGDLKQPVRRVRVRAWKTVFDLDPQRGGLRYGDFATDDFGFADLDAFLADAAAFPGPSVEVWASNEVVKMVNGQKGGAEYKQKIEGFNRNSRVLEIRDENWAFNHANRLYAIYHQLRSFLGPIAPPTPIRANWGHLMPSSMALPWGEVIIGMEGSREKVPEYMRSDEVLREELGHAIHFLGIRKDMEIAGSYSAWFVNDFLRQYPQYYLPPDPERPPRAGTIFKREDHPSLRGAGDLQEAKGGTHAAAVLTTETVAYVEAFGLLAHYGGYSAEARPSKGYPTWLEGLRGWLREKQGIPNGRSEPRLDTVMTADKVIRSEGHLAVLLFLDFPETADTSIQEVFGEMIRSRAVTFRQLARHYRATRPDQYRALAKAAVRHNIALDMLLQ